MTKLTSLIFSLLLMLVTYLIFIGKTNGKTTAECFKPGESYEKKRLRTEEAVRLNNEKPYSVFYIVPITYHLGLVVCLAGLLSSYRFEYNWVLYLVGTLLLFVSTYWIGYVHVDKLTIFDEKFDLNNVAKIEEGFITKITIVGKDNIHETIHISKLHTHANQLIKRIKEIIDTREQDNSRKS